MTFAEIFAACLLVAGIYRLLRPVRRRLERWLAHGGSPTLTRRSSTVTLITKKH